MLVLVRNKTIVKITKGVVSLFQLFFFHVQNNFNLRILNRFFFKYQLIHVENFNFSIITLKYLENVLKRSPVKEKVNLL